MANVKLLNPTPNLGQQSPPTLRPRSPMASSISRAKWRSTPKTRWSPRTTPKRRPRTRSGRIRTILAEVGATLDDIVSATVFITDLKHFGPFNEAWAAEFGDHRPARATVVAGLLLPGLVVEIQAVAALPR